jgi:3,4-dehydroadipyl-CoA semialdehyde dehydrogenase
MVRLKSYIQDAWVEGTAPFSTLYNPATEEAVAETSTRGVDFAAAFAHARDVGGPALRAMTFAERGAMLKGLSKALYAERERLLDVAMQNGAGSRGDAKFDVDGATGTLAYYASVGKRLGDQKHLVDGEVDKLTASARFGGLHLLVPRQGVAVHVNAFNFPAWGTFEKAAVALLAGVPVISKPATSTAWLAYEMVKIAVESGLLPLGSLQFVAGSAGDLLSHLGGQDMLAFTGSADTGAKLRAGEGPVAASTRVNVEADSLNAAVLGPDVERDSTLWHWFVNAVVLEMTQKTGQKCTAIRRVFAPSVVMDDLQEDIAEALGRVVVGAPGADGATMGPLATASQLRDYREGVAYLAEQAKVVYGSAVEVSPVGAPEGKGYYAAPVLLRAESIAGATRVHEREVFGPVATLLPYESPEEAARGVAMGGGSLVTSVASDNRGFLQAMGLAIGPWNGRVMVIDSKVADQSTPHGMVLPQLVHGGPGRAGGGEELGGERGLRFYLQRVGLQGNRALLEKLFS